METWRVLVLVWAVWTLAVVWLVCWWQERSVTDSGDTTGCGWGVCERSFTRERCHR